MTPEQQAVIDALAKEFETENLALTNETGVVVALGQAVSDLAARVTKLETPVIIVPPPPPPPPPPVVWPILGHDDIQNGAPPVKFPGPGWGFDWCQCDHPVNTVLAAPSDALGANLSAVPDPTGLPRKVLRHFIDLTINLSTGAGGGRSQAGWAGVVNPAFNTQAILPSGIYIAMDMFFPSVLDAKNDAAAWISICDWHSLDPNQANRLHTNPGTFLAKDGSMRFKYGWGPLWATNPDSALSTIPFPVGRWFTFEQFRAQAVDKSGVVRTWIDGQLALEQTGVQTTVPGNLNGKMEWYDKFYGANGAQPWTPNPATKYSCNVRWGNGRLT